jgi:hypothetical protein
MKPLKCNYPRRKAAAALGLVSAKPGYLTPEQAAIVAQWQAEADAAIEKETCNE